MKLGHLPLLILLPQMALAQVAVLPEGAEPIEKEARKGEISLPVGTYGLVLHPSEVLAGDILRQAWKISGTNSAAQMLEQLINQYERQGYEIAWRCETSSCGGYDFRYNIEASPPPDFVVNLDDFYYVDMRQGDNAVTMLISAVDDQVYLQEIIVTPFDDEAEIIETQTVTAVPPSAAQDTNSRSILWSVTFASGGTTPSSYDDAELQAIADRLNENSEETAYVVGHSDETGGLSANLSITKARAASVRQILIDKFSAPANRIIADGVAFLAPIADNATEEGRAENRRVEVVYLTN